MSQNYSDPERAEDPYSLPDVETFYVDGDKLPEFHRMHKGRNARKLPADHAPTAYWKAAREANSAKRLARIYCMAATKGHSKMEYLRHHALANLALRNVCTLALIHAHRYGWNLAEGSTTYPAPRL